MHVACLLSACHCLFSDYASQYLLQMGGPTPFEAELPNLTWWGGGIFLWCQPRPRPKGVEPQRSLVWGVLYLYLHPLTRNDHVRHGNTWGRGVFLGVNHACSHIVAEPQPSPILGVLFRLSHSTLDHALSPSQFLWYKCWPRSGLRQLLSQAAW